MHEHVPPSRPSMSKRHRSQIALIPASRTSRRNYAGSGRRALLLDSAMGLILALTSWMACFYVWGRSEVNARLGAWTTGRVINTVASSPWVLPGYSFSRWY